MVQAIVGQTVHRAPTSKRSEGPSSTASVHAPADPLQQLAGRSGLRAVHGIGHDADRGRDHRPGLPWHRADRRRRRLGRLHRRGGRLQRRPALGRLGARAGLLRPRRRGADRDRRPGRARPPRPRPGARRRPEARRGPGAQGGRGEGGEAARPQRDRCRARDHQDHQQQHGAGDPLELGCPRPRPARLLDHAVRRRRAAAWRGARGSGLGEGRDRAGRARHHRGGRPPQVRSPVRAHRVGPHRARRRHRRGPRPPQRRPREAVQGA